MRKASFAAITCCCLAATCALADVHLEPCQDHLDEYNSRVEAISRSAMPGDVEFVVTVIPSFQPEWSVGISAEGGRLLLTHVVFKPSLWRSSSVQLGPNTFGYDFSKPHIRAMAKTTNITADLREALRSEWDRSIADTRPTEEIGLDGVTFDFQLLGRCGRAWSPAPESRNGKLVDLVMALARLADSKDDASHATAEAVVWKKLKALPPP